MKLLAAILVIWCVFVNVGFGDIIVLKSGKELQGKIVAKTDTHFFMRTNEDQKKIAITDIKEHIKSNFKLNRITSRGARQKNREIVPPNDVDILLALDARIPPFVYRTLIHTKPRIERSRSGKPRVLTYSMRNSTAEYTLVFKKRRERHTSKGNSTKTKLESVVFTSRPIPGGQNYSEDYSAQYSPFNRLMQECEYVRKKVYKSAGRQFIKKWEIYLDYGSDRLKTEKRLFRDTGQKNAAYTKIIKYFSNGIKQIETTSDKKSDQVEHKYDTKSSLFRPPNPPSFPVK